jgi:rsbT antagonist protein RsbS
MQQPRISRTHEKNVAHQPTARVAVQTRNILKPTQFVYCWWVTYDHELSGSQGTDFFVPILKLGNCLFVSVPSEITDSQVRALQESVAKRLSQEKRIHGLVIDVSSLGIVDSFTAKMLGETASIARTFGSKAVLVGMRPGVAVTLVDLGIDLVQVETALTLEQALKKLRLKIVAVDET